MESGELHEKVVDKDSFIAFVRALAAERERAEPLKHMLDGPGGWKNSTISDFLYAALDYFDEKPFHRPERTPSWKMLADFLYFGKIIE